MTVFVVQDSPGKNLLPAQRFGELVILVPHVNGDRPFSVESDVDMIWEKLKKYGMTRHDYVLPIGDPVLIGIATALAADITDGRFKILKYDRQEKDYLVVDVDLWEGD